jgi:dihydrofolate reductase
MRKLILKMHVSIDGFVGGAGGKVDWLFQTMDPAAVAWTVDTVWNAGLHIMGSRTFHDMAAYWPTSTEVFAPPMNQIPKAVFSKQGPAILKNTNTEALKDAARANAKDGQPAVLQPGAESWTNPYVASGELKEEIAWLKSQEGKPIVAHGGAGFARSLVASGVIDEYHLLVHPVALGKGLPLFSELASPRALNLIKSLPFARGAVAQIYRHEQAEP